MKVTVNNSPTHPIVVLSESSNYREMIKEQIKLMAGENFYPDTIMFMEKSHDTRKGEYICNFGYTLNDDDLQFCLKLDESDDITKFITIGLQPPDKYDAIQLCFSNRELAKRRYERNKKS